MATFSRQCVFAGTVNGDDYLRDETGGRRFWPIRAGATGPIDLDGLREARDQIWAEAVHRYRDGEVWWFDSEDLRCAAEVEQAARYQGDPWDDIVWAYVDEQASMSARLGEPVRVGIDDILGHLGVDVRDRSQRDQTRVARCLRARGWERKQERVGRSGRRRWIYVPPVTTNDSSGDK